MNLRIGIVVLATSLLAAQGLAEIKTYFIDADQSTKFLASDQRIYRGDCDPGAATPNAGDNGALADDQCRCTPGFDCALGAVPVPLICTGGPRLGLNCTIAAHCPAAACAAGVGADACGASNGRPNGGACDPTIAFPGAGSCAPGFVTHGSPEPPCHTAGGTAVIDDTGSGTPTLESLSLQSSWDDFLGTEAIVGVPGATVSLHSETTLSPAPDQTGTGSTTTSISWGPLVGWVRVGSMTCDANCGFCIGACAALGTVFGVGPPYPLKAGVFVTDPWVFQGDEFTAASIEIVSIGGGATTESVQLGGRRIDIPLLPLAALAGLGCGLAYLGAQGLRRRPEQTQALQTTTGPG